MEAVHEKGFTDVGAAAEYLLTTGNLEGYSVENMAPKEHKYEKHPFHPFNQSQFLKTVSREGNLLKSRYLINQSRERIVLTIRIISNLSYLYFLVYLMAFMFELLKIVWICSR